MSIYDENYGVPTGSVPSANQPQPLNQFWQQQPMTPNIPTGTVILTAEQKKQLEDSYLKNKKHNHYFKDVSNLKTIDIYRVLELYEVTDQCIGHAIKKLLVAGGRGAGKSIEKDVQEAIDTLLRYQEIMKENNV